jgi:Rad3-related DNA helicase
MKYWNQRFAKTGIELTPRMYSSGNTQETVIKTCVDFFINVEPQVDEDGTQLPVFALLKGGVGSGKSSIGLGVLSFFPKGQLVVPTKILQDQYKDDYSGDDARINVFKPNGEKLKITTPKGKSNFKCIYKNNPIVDAKCDFSVLPCNLPLSKKETRTDVAIECPHWSPIYPDINEMENPRNSVIELQDRSIEQIFNAMKGKKVYYRTNKDIVCPYYKQYDDILNADVIITNSAKFKVEQMIGRMPKSDIVVIDEADEFLDNLSQSAVVNLDRILNTISELEYKYKTEIEHLFHNIIIDSENEKYKYNKSEIIELKEHKLFRLFTLFLKSDISKIEDLTEVSAKIELMSKYYNDVVFEFEKRKLKNGFHTIVNLNLLNFKGYMKDLFSGFKYVLFMSGTFIENNNILKEMYGFNKIPTLHTERTISGTLNYRISKNAKKYNKTTLDANREQFLKSYDNAISAGIKKGNVLVHVKSYATDCKSKEEDPDNTKYPNIPYGEDLRIIQQTTNLKESINEFKKNRYRILFSTNCVRGVDLPDDECRIIIIPRLPYPQLNTFWNGINKKYTRLNRIDIYWSLYNDKMFRELIQAVARGLRHPNDEVTIICFDSRLNDKLKAISKL